MSQTAKAILYSDAGGCLTEEVTAAAAGEHGDVLQMADGSAGVVLGADAATNSFAAGDRITLARTGLFRVLKTASVILLDGGEVMWDHSAESATYPIYVTDKDFNLGRIVGDAAGSDSTIIVELNADRNAAYIALQKSAFLNASINTAGFIKDAMVGGAFRSAFSATNEAQKIDLLSMQGFEVESNWICEGVFNVIATADADVADLSIGVANGTHATDADSITESCFIHLDLGGSLNIFCESDDGTTEVVATDSTVNFVVGTPVHFVIDGRDTADIQIYLNGVNVLAATVFKLDAATGPLKALFHFEKTANDTLGNILLSKLEVRQLSDVEA